MSRSRDLAMEPAAGEVRCNFGHTDPGMDDGTEAEVEAQVEAEVDADIDVGMHSDIDAVLAEEQEGEAVQMSGDIAGAVLVADGLDVIHMAMDTVMAVVVVVAASSVVVLVVDVYLNTRIHTKNSDK